VRLWDLFAALRALSCEILSEAQEERFAAAFCGKAQEFLRHQQLSAVAWLVHQRLSGPRALKSTSGIITFAAILSSHKMSALPGVRRTSSITCADRPVSACAVDTSRG
jgi:hypothetical protein